MKKNYPNPLNKGDTIAIISPSAGLASIFPHRLDNAIKFLKSQGYNIKEYNCTRKMSDWESGSAPDRSKDLMNAFLDEDVKAIMCTIGGNTSNKLLEHIDFNIIKEKPKIFCGYSDITVLHLAFYHKSDLISFYGPSAMNQFGEYPNPLEYTVDYFLKAVSKREIGEIHPSKFWTDELLNWFNKEDLTRSRNMKENNGTIWLKKGKAEGSIIGGCLSSLMHLSGTEYWPNFKDKILFIETPEGQEFGKGQPLAEVDSELADLRNLGVFNSIKGLIVGRPYLYSSENDEKFKKVILENTIGFEFPILYGSDIGHTDPQITIPIGANTILDSENNKFIINTILN